MEKQKRTPLPVVGIIAWHGRAYVPVIDLYEHGLYVDSEPVYVVALSKEELVKAVRAVKDAGHKIIPRPKSREEFLARKDPVLATTGAKSWKNLAKTGASYTIDWALDKIQLDMSRLDKKGMWEYDPEKKRLFPPDTSIEEIVEIILEDVKTRPEIFQ